jgi:hypothetical protein
LDAQDGALNVEMEEKIAVLARSFSANLSAGKMVLDIVDAIHPGVPEESRVAKMLEQFAIAADCARMVAETSKKEGPEVIQAVAKWKPQDDSLGMI